jgi:DNA-binding transcriptional MerR regulator
MLGETQPTLRVWGEAFKEILPVKTNAGKTRLYTPENIEVLRNIQYLLRERGYKHDGALAKFKADRAQTRKNCDIASRLNKVKKQLSALRRELNKVTAEE